MNFVTNKFKSTCTGLWNHKKKTLFALGCLAYGTNWIQLSVRDDKIRQFYAQEAKKHGDKGIFPTAQLKRVTVLINDNANGRKASSLFKKNAFPLLHLAGIEANIIDVKDEIEMEKLGKVLDKSETDCIYIVGGDGTISKVISGIMSNDSQAVSSSIPICVFPGGKKNEFLSFQIPEIMKNVKDVRKYCESAMAIIEESMQEIYPIKCDIVNNSDKNSLKTIYVLSSLRAGWFEHCEQRKPKLWYFGALRSYYAYFWEFLKRYPEPMKFLVSYQDYCSGCNQCYKKNELKIQNSSKIKFQSDKSFKSRLEAMKAGWTQTANNSSQNDTSICANKLEIRFSFIPEFIQKLSIGGDWAQFENFTEKTVQIEKSNRALNIYIPKNFNRFKLEDL